MINFYPLVSTMTMSTSDYLTIRHAIREPEVRRGTTIPKHQIVGQPHSAIALRNRRTLFALMLWRLLSPAYADDVVADKSDCTLFNLTPDSDLRTFSTDRPPKANGPYTVDAGHFQYETDLAVFGYGNSGGTKTHDWTALDPTLKLGLTNNTDLELQLTPYQSVATRSAAGKSSVSGLGDTFARLKINLLGNNEGAMSIALLPYVKLPTADSSLGNGKVEGGLILPLSFSAPGGFTVIVMPEGDYLKNFGVAGYHAAFDFLINVSHPLNKRWTAYSEVFTSQFFDARDPALYTLDEAVTYAITPNLQLDLGGNFSLNKVALRTQLYSGLSQRF